MTNRRFSLAVHFVLLASAEVAISAADAPVLNRTQLSAAEKSVDQRMLSLWSDNSLSLVGASRAVYLPGIGLVVSAEVNLAMAPISLMGPSLTDNGKAELRKKKVDRLPILRTAMKEVMANLAASLSQIPVTDQIAFSVVLPRYSWEDPSVIPVQVVMQATRQDLLGPQRDKAIRVVESN